MKRSICKYFGVMFFVSGLLVGSQSSVYAQFPGGSGGLGGGSFGSTGGLGGLSGVASEVLAD